MTLIEILKVIKEFRKEIKRLLKSLEKRLNYQVKRK